MKIAILANNATGLYLFRRQLIRELLAGGNEVLAFTPYTVDVENLRSLGVIVIDTPMDRRGTNPVKDLSLLKQYRNELKKVQPDFVITYTIKPNVYGGLACRLLNIPYAANVTGLGSAFEGKGLLRMAVKILNRTGLKRASVVFFENTENCRLFIDEGIVKKSRTHVLSGAGVDLDYFSYQKYPENDVFRFLFIGRIMKEKGVDELLEAIRRLRGDGFPCLLDVLGTYEENYSQTLHAAQEEGWMRFHGFCSDVRPFIRECDCFVLPSYHEGMANTNLECASSGRPLITSNIPGCREALIQDRSGFLCEPKNADSLFYAMKRMLQTDREKREEMGKAGRRHMEEVFDKNKVVADTIRFLPFSS